MLYSYSYIYIYIYLFIYLFIKFKKQTAGLFILYLTKKYLLNFELHFYIIDLFKFQFF